MRESTQQGLTLTELLIAMALGSVLVLGVIQVFMSGKASYTVQESLARLQDNGRYADFFLERTLRQAGRPQERVPTNNFQPVDFRPDGSGEPATRDGGANGNGPDVVTVMYRSNTNCLGNNTNYGAQSMVDAEGALYARDQFFLDDENPPNLRCVGLGANGLPTPGNNQPVVEGVEDFQLLYGVDVDGDGQPNQYLRASDVPNLQRENIVSIRYAVLLRSEDAMGAAMRGTTTSDRRYAVLDAPMHGPFDDQRLREVFQSTVELRNRTQ